MSDLSLFALLHIRAGQKSIILESSILILSANGIDEIIPESVLKYLTNVLYLSIRQTVVNKYKTLVAFLRNLVQQFHGHQESELLPPILLSLAKPTPTT